MWVVRDFVNHSQETFSAKQYLEGALQEKNGISDKNEEINRTKRFIKNLFVDRECYTMAKLTGDAADNETEVVRQMNIFKKRVLGKSSAKIFQQKVISGEILANLTEHYVDSLNAHSAPNVANIGKLVFEQLCDRAVTQSFEEFKHVVGSRIQMPCTPLDLKMDYGLGKKVAVEMFKSLAIGGPVEEAEIRLKNQIREAYQRMNEQNVQACQVVCNQFLHQHLFELQEKLKASKFKDLSEVESCLEDVEKSFYESVQGNSDTCKMIYEDFRSQIIMDAAQSFMSHLQAEVKAKEFQMKKAEEAKGGATLIEQNQRRGLEDKLKAKDVEITHLKSSIGELTTGVRELQRLAADELE